MSRSSDGQRRSDILPFSGYLEYRELEERLLPEWACRYREPESRPWGSRRTDHFERLGYRTEFQRDRDDILYSLAFRQLAYKRQMISSPLEESFYTRLTHTLIVAQIARSIAKGLRLEENLTEAIALGHDLGHAPYGHSGEEGIDRFLIYTLFPRLVQKDSLKGAQDLSAMKRLNRERELELAASPETTPYPLFQIGVAEQMNELEKEFLCTRDDTDIYKHNRQSYRLLKTLEKGTTGLQLCIETYYGILRASGSARDDDGFEADKGQITTEFASFEAQVVRLADDIAWINHDLTEDYRKIGQEPNEMLQEYLSQPDAKELHTHPDELLELLRARSGERYGKFITDVIRSNKDKLQARGYADSPSYAISLSERMGNALEDMRQIIASVIHGSSEMKEIANSASREIERMCIFLVDRENFKSLIDSSMLRGRSPEALSTIERCRIVADAVAFMSDNEAYEFYRKYFLGYRRPRIGGTVERLKWPLAR